MVIDTQAWLRASAGGLLIGLAAGLMIVFNGRIAGISGVLGGLLFNPAPGDRRWRSLFLGGIVIGAVVLAQLLPALPAARLETGWLGMAAAGLIVRWIEAGAPDN